MGLRGEGNRKIKGLNWVRGWGNVSGFKKDETEDLEDQKVVVLGSQRRDSQGERNNEINFEYTSISYENI